MATDFGCMQELQGMQKCLVSCKAPLCAAIGKDQSGEVAQSTGSGEQARTDHNAEQLSRCPPDSYADLLRRLEGEA